MVESVRTRELSKLCGDMTSKEVTIVTGKVEVRAVDTSFARHVTVCTAAS